MEQQPEVNQRPKVNKEKDKYIRASTIERALDDIQIYNEYRRNELEKKIEQLFYIMLFLYMLCILQIEFKLLDHYNEAMYDVSKMRLSDPIPFYEFNDVEQYESPYYISLNNSV